MSNAPGFIDTHTVLIVDDAPENLALMFGLLKDHYRTKIANGGERALAIAAEAPHPDLMLLDVMMPGMDGYEVCRRLKADPKTKNVAVIFLTAKAEVEDEQMGFDVGGVDYITKPISAPIVLARVKTHLKLKAVADFLRDKSEFLETEVLRRTREVLAAGPRAAALARKAIAIIREARDKQFDAAMTDALLELEQEFHAIAERYAASEADVEPQGASVTMPGPRSRPG